MAAAQVYGGRLAELALGENLEADVAAHLGSLVVLFGEHGADETDQGLPVRGRALPPRPGS
jgi:hypothetical protein